VEREDRSLVDAVEKRVDLRYDCLQLREELGHRLHHGLELHLVEHIHLAGIGRAAVVAAAGEALVTVCDRQNVRDELMHGPRRTRRSGGGVGNARQPVEPAAGLGNALPQFVAGGVDQCHSGPLILQHGVKDTLQWSIVKE
jgi:hypothetical protein